MKTLLFLLFTLSATFSYGQYKDWKWENVTSRTWSPDDLSYNKKHHSIRRHAKTIYRFYSFELGLSKSQQKQLRAIITDHLTWAHQNIWALGYYGETNTPFWKDQLRQGNVTQSFLQARFAEMLTKEQYSRYQKMIIQPEKFFAQGGPF